MKNKTPNANNTNVVAYKDKGKDRNRGPSRVRLGGLNHPLHHKYER